MFLTWLFILVCVPYSALNSFWSVVLTLFIILVCVPTLIFTLVCVPCLNFILVCVPRTDLYTGLYFLALLFILICIPSPDL